MRKELLAIVCCPVHKTPLEAKVKRRDEAGDILEGSLTCAACRFAYPIEEGIPNLLPPEYHADGVREAQEANGSGKAQSSRAASRKAKGKPSVPAKARPKGAK